MSNLIEKSNGVPRPLTLKERELTLWLIEHPTEKNVPDVHDQVDRLTVHDTCACGCPTINFALDGINVTGKGSRLISDYYAEVDGQDVGVMLFEAEGRLSCLEVYSCGGSDEPFGLPEISTIRTLDFKKV